MLNAVNIYGQTPLHLATLNKSSYSVYLLISAGVELNKSDRKGQTALHLANASIARKLIASGAELDKVDRRGYTALNKAARSRKR